MFIVIVSSVVAVPQPRPEPTPPEPIPTPPEPIPTPPEPIPTPLEPIPAPPEPISAPPEPIPAPPEPIPAPPEPIPAPPEPIPAPPEPIPTPPEPEPIPTPPEPIPTSTTKSIVLPPHIYMVPIIIIAISVFIIVSSPSIPRVIELYGSGLRVKYIETLTNQMNSEYPTAGRASVSNIPFIPLISIVVKDMSKETAHRLNSKEIQDEKIQIEDILKPRSEKRLRFVLIEGEPGIGKSMLAKELVLRWANRSDKLINNYDIVFLIQLHFETYHKATSIEDLFVDLDDQSINKTDLHVGIKKRKGAGILWILDGFDELPSHLKRNSMLMNLIKGYILPKSTVIVTSRPVASGHLFIFLDGRNSKRISIRGFNSTMIEEYALKYFNDKDKASKFHSYYNGNLVIESMLYNPLHCFIVCTIFNDFIATNNEQYPKTMTSLYNHYVRIVLKRHLIKTGLISDTNYEMPPQLMLETDFNDPTLQSVWKDFSLLSKIAYNGVMNQQYIFGKELHYVTKLSMMDTIVNFYVFEKDESSSFLRTTLQEYFAAVYLVNNKLNVTMKNNKLHPKFEVVLMFYVGICKMTGKELDSTIVNILNRSMTTLNDKYIYIDSALLGCLYEDDSLLYKIGLPANHSLYISSTSTNFDYYILGYLVAVHNITYYAEFSTSDQIKAFNDGLQSQLSHSPIKGKLRLFAGYLSKENGQIKELLRLPSSLVIELVITISSSDISEFCQIITKFHALQTVILHAHNLQWSCNEAPENPLLELKKLNKLVISINPLHEKDLVTLEQLIAPDRPIKILQVVNYTSSYNKILNIIEMQTSLEELTITDGVDVYGAETFSSIWNQKLPMESQHIIWTKSTNNLMVDDYEMFFYDIKITTLPTIQLSSFTSFTYIKVSNSVNMRGRWTWVNVTVYSESTFKLNHFIDAFRECIKKLPVKDTTNETITKQLDSNFICTSTIAKRVQQDEDITCPNTELLSAKDLICNILFFSIIIILTQCQLPAANARPLNIYLYLYLEIVFHVDLLDVLLVCFFLLILYSIYLIFLKTFSFMYFLFSL